jgi:DNA-binding protein YbaB
MQIKYYITIEIPDSQVHSDTFEQLDDLVIDALDQATAKVDGVVTDMEIK